MSVCKAEKHSSYLSFGGESCFGAVLYILLIRSFVIQMALHFQRVWMKWTETRRVGPILWLWRCVCGCYERNRWLQALFGLVGTLNNWQTVGFDHCYRAVEKEQKLSTYYFRFQFTWPQCAASALLDRCAKRVNSVVEHNIACINDYFTRFPRYYANIIRHCVCFFCIDVHFYSVLLNFTMQFKPRQQWNLY